MFDGFEKAGLQSSAQITDDPTAYIEEQSQWTPEKHLMYGVLFATLQDLYNSRETVRDEAYGWFDNYDETYLYNFVPVVEMLNLLPEDIITYFVKPAMQGNPVNIRNMVKAFTINLPGPITVE